ncbi:MAG: GWxTD domain-containing protein [Bacteroidetes bacterium]|nr:GWxTD domain-containing protein [Bacteroidota bacterium]
MKLLYSVVLFFISIQLLHSEIEENKFRYSIWLNPPQVKENFVLSFKIRHDLLIFNKTATDTFKANVQVQLEIMNERDFVINRQVLEVNLSCTTYEQTIAKDLFYENKFSLLLPKEKLKARLSLNDMNRNFELKIPVINYSLTDKVTISPIFIQENDVRLIFSDSILSRFSNSFLFSSEKMVLVLPFNPETKKIFVESGNKQIEVERINSYSTDFSLFDLDTLGLNEGDYFIKYNPGSKDKIPFKVIWYDKPEYLKNVSAAIKLAEYIFDGEFTKGITSYSDESRYKELFQAWKRFDPTPNTPFNELMSEFYQRADYASISFKSLQVPDGALSDRGKIYMLYGTPKSIDRSFNPQGKAVEIWKYEGQINHQFIFIDEEKNGNLKIKK